MVESTEREATMAIARVVTFEGVSAERMQQLKTEMAEGDRPEGVPASELIMLHDPASEKSLVIAFFESEDDYQRGHEILDEMPAEDTPGRRTSVTKYDVAIRGTA
jgi:hypothetical protein